MKKNVAAWFAIAHFWFAAAAGAAILVDTGPGPSSGGFALSANQFIAAEFTLGGPAVITDIQGWIGAQSVPPFTSGQATAVLYTDGGEIPGTQIFAATFTADLAADFDGPSGLAVPLAPGTYWVAFEVRPGDTANTLMPVPSASPLPNVAVNVGGGYIAFDTPQIGVRILGNIVTAAPEPASLLLLGLGLGALAWSRRARA